ncbi:MAG: succinate dehydrogenase/fumarate reductase iron-sulfur subunit [Chloroflexi bacterium]|nr:succinate dehydrogenase/fumarate reductase iron-sulfur subunit [Chloroflexota bacterium]
MKKVNLKVKRFDPETHETKYQEYKVEVDDNAAVLDAIIDVREYQDPTLAARCSCRSAICGSCGMRINGRARLACKTKVIELLPAGDTITVEPLGNMETVKDLVADMSTFWAKVRQVQPWLKPSQPAPDREYIAPQDAMADLLGAMNCIMCGACVSDCTSLEVDKNFIGPAALAKAYRFVGDPRETEAAREERLRDLTQPGGVWDCTHCFMCVQVCPKDVAPMERIVDIRRTAMEAGYRDNNGARHSDSFARSVKESGWLDELRIVPESFGLDDIGPQVQMIPTALRAIVKRKMPPVIHHKRPGHEHVKRIFKELEHE